MSLKPRIARVEEQETGGNHGTVGWFESFVGSAADFLYRSAFGSLLPERYKSTTPAPSTSIGV